jgi:sulfur relay (sulfurtransferase) DsrF/TusC family protein
VRRFFYSATLKLYPTKCYLKPQRFQEFMFETQTVIAILELVRPQNLQMYIDTDEVTLMRFSEFEEHLQGKLF